MYAACPESEVFIPGGKAGGLGPLFSEFSGSAPGNPRDETRTESKQTKTYNLGQNLAKLVETHYKNTYFLHSSLQSQIKRPFTPPLLQCCLQLQKKCTLGLLSQNNITPGVERGGGGGICSLWTRWLHGAKLKTALKCLNTFIRACRLFCGGFEKSRFQSLHKAQFQNFLELYVRGRIYCFFNKFLILLGNRSRSESMRGFN